MGSRETKFIVVGAGVAGLSAALRIKALGHEVTVLDAASRAGGLIETEQSGGFTFEHGPDGFLASKGNVLEELGELGLLDQLVTKGPGPRRAFVANARGLTPLPAGLFRFERKAMLGMLRSPLLSSRAKMRLFAEPFIRRSSDKDEDVAGFFSRRLGSEVADRIVSPMLRGIYGSPAAELGMHATMPKLSAMEERFGSLGIALLSAPRAVPGVGLATLQGGMGSLVERMLERLGPVVRTGAKVTRIETCAEGVRVHLANEVLTADGVVVACPAYAASKVLEEADQGLGALLGSIPHKRSDSVGLAYDATAFPSKLDGTGFVMDAALGGTIVACTWSSQKWPGRAPIGGVLLRCVAQDPNAADPELVATVREMLRRTLGVEEAPTMVRIRRRAQALPTYAVGHLDLVARAKRVCRQLGPIALAGNAYEGVGVPDCIASGRAAANTLCA